MRVLVWMGLLIASSVTLAEEPAPRCVTIYITNATFINKALNSALFTQIKDQLPPSAELMEVRLSRRGPAAQAEFTFNNNGTRIRRSLGIQQMCDGQVFIYMP